MHLWICKFDDSFIALMWLADSNSSKKKFIGGSCVGSAFCSWWILILVRMQGRILDSGWVRSLFKAAFLIESVTDWDYQFIAVSCWCYLSDLSSSNSLYKGLKLSVLCLGTSTKPNCWLSNIVSVRGDSSFWESFQSAGLWMNMDLSSYNIPGVKSLQTSEKSLFPRSRAFLSGPWFLLLLRFWVFYLSHLSLQLQRLYAITIISIGLWSIRDIVALLLCFVALTFLYRQQQWQLQQ